MAGQTTGKTRKPKSPKKPETSSEYVDTDHDLPSDAETTVPVTKTTNAGKKSLSSGDGLKREITKIVTNSMKDHDQGKSNNQLKQALTSYLKLAMTRCTANITAEEKFKSGIETKLAQLTQSASVTNTSKPKAKRERVAPPPESD